jgi:hypothetical protein
MNHSVVALRPNGHRSSFGDDELRWRMAGHLRDYASGHPVMHKWSPEVRKLTMAQMGCSTRLIGDGGEQSFADFGDVWRERNGVIRPTLAFPSRFLLLRR